MLRGLATPALPRWPDYQLPEVQVAEGHRAARSRDAIDGDACLGDREQLEAIEQPRGRVVEGPGAAVAADERCRGGLVLGDDGRRQAGRLPIGDAGRVGWSAHRADGDGGLPPWF